MGNSIPRTPRLLIVEDDLATLAALKAIFVHRGWAVDTAQTLAGAHVLLAEGPTHLILDVKLPDGLGVELLAHIREWNYPVVVIITTGAFVNGVIDQIKALHPDRLFIKPIDLADLLAAVGEPKLYPHHLAGDLP